MTITAPDAFATLPEPPYYIVAFSSLRCEGDEGYGAMADAMATLAAQQPGFLGMESARGADGFGITNSYWRDEAALTAWKGVAKHLLAQKLGKERWYEHYALRVARVERAYIGPEGRQIMPLMFAYGANMDVVEMAKRAPGSKPLGLARLPRHRFVITMDGYASVMHSAKHAVHGLLWDIALADMPALDRFEGIHRGLYRKTSQMVITTSGAKRALIYIGAGEPGGMPKPGYLEGILGAAEATGLPEAYRGELAGWAKGGAALTQTPSQKPVSGPRPYPALPRAGRDPQGL